MADIKISQLSAISNVGDADVMPIVANNVTLKVSAEKLKDYIIGTTDNTDLGADVSTQIQTLANQKADKSELTTIVQNGTNATQNIDRNTFFYLNGSLVHALQTISNGSAFSLGTNYENVPDGGLNMIFKHFIKSYFTGELDSEGYINIGGKVRDNFPIGVLIDRRGWAYAYVTGNDVWSLYVYDPVTGQHATGTISGTAYFITAY